MPGDFFANRTTTSRDAACRAKLEANFVPGFVQVLTQIPKTASEKPQERFLLESFDTAAANVHQRDWSHRP